MCCTYRLDQRWYRDTVALCFPYGMQRAFCCFKWIQPLPGGLLQREKLYLLMFSRNLFVPDFVRKTPGIHLFHLSGNTPESLLPDSSEFKVDPLLSDDNRYAIRDNSYLVVILLNDGFCLLHSFFHAVCRNHMQVFY